MLERCPRPNCGGAIIDRGWGERPTCNLCGRSPGWTPLPACKVRVEPMPRKQNHRPRGGGRRTDLTTSIEIAERLTAFLNQHRMTHATFAERAGIGKSSIANCLQGHALTPRVLAAIERAIAQEVEMQDQHVLDLRQERDDLRETVKALRCTVANQQAEIERLNSWIERLKWECD